MGCPAAADRQVTVQRRWRACAAAPIAWTNNRSASAAVPRPVSAAKCAAVSFFLMSSSPAAKSSKRSQRRQSRNHLLKTFDPKCYDEEPHSHGRPPMPGHSCWIHRPQSCRRQTARSNLVNRRPKLTPYRRAILMEWTPPPDGIAVCQGGVVFRPPEEGGIHGRS